MRKIWSGFISVAAVSITLVMGAHHACAQTVINVATSKSAGAAILYMAQDRGYFSKEGIEVHWNYFDDPNDLAASVIAGQDDVAFTGLIAGFFNIAESEHLKVIAGMIGEKPGFHSATYVATTAAYAAGLRKPEDLLHGNKRIGISQLGSTHEYALLLLARKYKVDPHSMHMIPMQSGGNIFAALKENAIDGAVMSSVPAATCATQGICKIIGYVGDEVPYTSIVLYSRANVINSKHKALVRFMRAMLHASKDYAAAFEQSGSDGKPLQSPAADNILKVVSKYTGQPISVISQSMTYVVPNGNLPVDDLRTQVALWQATGMVDKSVSASDLVDGSILDEARKN